MFLRLIRTTFAKQSIYISQYFTIHYFRRKKTDIPNNTIFIYNQTVGMVTGKP